MWEEAIRNSNGNIVGYLQDDGEKYHLLNANKDLVSRIPKENLTMINSIMTMLNHEGVEPEANKLLNTKVRMSAGIVSLADIYELGYSTDIDADTLAEIGDKMNDALMSNWHDYLRIALDELNIKKL